MKRSFFFILSLLLSISCNDDNQKTKSISSLEWTPPTPIQSFKKVVYRQPKGSKTKYKRYDQIITLPKQGDFWNDGGIMAKEDGIFEVSGVMVCDVFKGYKGIPDKISLYVYNDEGVLLGIISKNREHYTEGTMYNSEFGEHLATVTAYASFSGEKFDIKAGRKLIFKSDRGYSQDHGFTASSLEKIVISFKSK